jgi:hypothetical protein
VGVTVPAPFSTWLEAPPPGPPPGLQCTAAAPGWQQRRAAMAAPCVLVYDYTGPAARVWWCRAHGYAPAEERGVFLHPAAAAVAGAALP